MTCKDCIHNEVCYRREVCNDIEEHIRKLGCMDFIARADVQEIKHGEWIETQEPLGWCDVDCSENGEIHNTQYWVGYLDGLRRLYEKITDMSAAN